MRLAALLIASALLMSPASAQRPPDFASRAAAQLAAIKKLNILDGVWRGNAWTITPVGKHEIIQTERIGSFLGGAVKIIEGRGYDKNGAVAFNALGVVSYDPARASYSISSWAMGQSGVFPFKVRDDGYDWEIPAGPGATIKYSATIRGGEFVEVGHRVAGKGPPTKIFEMRLHRVGDTSWPAGNAVPMR